MRLDPAGKVERLRKMPEQRAVTIRPAPDTMAYLTALLPVTQAVAYAALRTAADSTTATGDQRGRGQIMADTLVERLTGQSHAQHVPLTVNLTITDHTLLAAGPDRDEPAHLDDGGPIPAPLARDLIAATVTDDGTATVPVWIRRLYTHPTTGALVTMETKSRYFTAAQRLFVKLRDHTCRTPYCDAPIRHTDHITDAAHGGPTTLTNAQGLCAACNHAKQTPGYTSRTQPDGSITTTTPSGQTYRSPPVSARRPASPRQRWSPSRRTPTVSTRRSPRPSRASSSG